MLKRIVALLCVLLLLIGTTVPVCALIAVQDENGEIRYSTDPLEEEKPQKLTAVREWAQRVMQRVKQYWQKHGVLTIVILLIVCVLGSVVVMTVEDEKKKQKAIDQRPKKKNKE